MNKRNIKHDLKKFFNELKDFVKSDKFIYGFIFGFCILFSALTIGSCVNKNTNKASAASVDLVELSGNNGYESLYDLYYIDKTLYPNDFMIQTISVPLPNYLYIEYNNNGTTDNTILYLTSPPVFNVDFVYSISKSCYLGCIYGSVSFTYYSRVFHPFKVLNTGEINMLTIYNAYVYNELTTLNGSVVSRPFRVTMQIGLFYQPNEITSYSNVAFNNSILDTISVWDTMYGALSVNYSDYKIFDTYLAEHVNYNIQHGDNLVKSDFDLTNSLYLGVTGDIERASIETYASNDDATPFINNYTGAYFKANYSAEPVDDLVALSVVSVDDNYVGGRFPITYSAGLSTSYPPLTFSSSLKTGTYDDGYDEGYDDGYWVGKDDGYSQGYVSGENAGYKVGYDDGYGFGYDFAYSEINATDVISQAYSRGYYDGWMENTMVASQYYDSGFIAGKNVATEEVYEEAYQQGVMDAGAGYFEDGYDVGFDYGYEEGYLVGINEQHIDENDLNLFRSVQIWVDSLMNTELFNGIAIKHLFMFCIGMFLLIVIIKTFLGG